MLPSYPIVEVRDGKLHARSARKAANAVVLDLPPRRDVGREREEALAALRAGEGDAGELARRVAECNRALSESRSAAVARADALASQVAQARQALGEQLGAMAPNGTPNNPGIRKLVERLSRLHEIHRQSRELSAVARRGVAASVIYEGPKPAEKREEVIRIVFSERAARSE